MNPLTRSQIRSRAWTKLSHLHPTEFASLRKAVYAEFPNIPHGRARVVALRQLAQQFREDYMAIWETLKPLRASAVPEPPYDPCRPRKAMDPIDARILFERGMTVPQIARYDNCTQRAVLAALIPQLANRRSSAGAWWESAPSAMSASELAELTGSFGPEVARVLDELSADR